MCVSTCLGPQFPTKQHQHTNHFHQRVWQSTPPVGEPELGSFWSTLGVGGSSVCPEVSKSTKLFRYVSHKTYIRRFICCIHIFYYITILLLHIHSQYYYYIYIHILYISIKCRAEGRATKLHGNWVSSVLYCKASKCICSQYRQDKFKPNWNNAIEAMLLLLSLCCLCFYKVTSIDMSALTWGFVSIE